MKDARKAHALIHGPLRGNTEFSELFKAVELSSRVTIHQSAWHAPNMNGTAFRQVITPPQGACGRHVLAIVIMSGKGHELNPFNWRTRDKKDINKLFDKKATNKIDWDAPEYTKLINPRREGRARRPEEGGHWTLEASRNLPLMLRRTSRLSSLKKTPTLMPMLPMTFLKQPKGISPAPATVVLAVTATINSCITRWSRAS
jgi:hypothetical protein